MVYLYIFWIILFILNLVVIYMFRHPEKIFKDRFNKS